MSQAIVNKKANAKLKEIYLDKDILYCEARLAKCAVTFALSWHHRHKRFWYRDKPEELLHSFNQTILVCNYCHSRAEYEKEIHERLFKSLRGEEK